MKEQPRQAVGWSAELRDPQPWVTTAWVCSGLGESRGSIPKMPLGSQGSAMTLAGLRAAPEAHGKGSAM